jgi:hypothetical protein
VEGSVTALTETERAELQRLRDERDSVQIGLALWRMDLADLEADLEEAVQLLTQHGSTEGVEGTDGPTAELTTRLRRRLDAWRVAGGAGGGD